MTWTAGRPTCGRVYGVWCVFVPARDRSTMELLAVKLMKRPIPKVMGSNIMREVKIGAQLGRGHLNIVKPKELILTR